MKVKIRNGVFETNSSSMHSISIKNNPDDIHIPENVDIKRGEFGWDTTYNYDMDEKISYFYEMCLWMDSAKENLVYKTNDKTYWREIQAYLADGYISRFVNYLMSKGIKVNSVELGKEHDGYIDHEDEWDNLCEIMLSNPDMLDSFLFSPSSYLTTGNDNDEYGYIPPPIDEKNYTIYKK